MAVLYHETFSGSGVIDGGLAALSPTVAPLTGPTQDGGHDCSKLSLSGTGFVYNNSISTSGLAAYIVTVTPMATGTIRLVGISQRDIGGVIGNATGTVNNGGNVCAMIVAASNVGKFFQFGYANVKAKDNPTYTSRVIGRDVRAEVDFASISEVIYTPTNDPFDLRIEFGPTQYEVFIDDVSVGVRSQSMAGAMYDTFTLQLWAKCGISSVQIDSGIGAVTSQFWTSFVETYETP